jgi:hypothetical protein
LRQENHFAEAEKTGSNPKIQKSRNKNLKNNKMKNLLILANMLLTFGFSNAQKFYTVNYESRADVKVFVVDYESRADLCVYKVNYESRAGKNDGKWFFVDYESRADKKIFFVDYESRADLKIFFVDYESLAGWRNASKKSLMY